MYNRRGGIYKNGGDGIGSYFLTLLTASVCGAVCTLLAWGGFEKYVKYISSLICIVLLISPLKSISIPDFSKEAEKAIPDTEAALPSLYSLSSTAAEKNAEEYLKSIIFEKFGINAVYADIRIDWDKQEPTIEQIVIALEKSDMHFAEATKAHLSQTLGNGVTVVEG